MDELILWLTTYPMSFLLVPSKGLAALKKLSGPKQLTILQILDRPTAADLYAGNSWPLLHAKSASV